MTGCAPPSVALGPHQQSRLSASVMCKRKHETESSEQTILDVLRALRPEARDTFVLKLPADTICAARLACSGMRQLVDEASSCSISVQLPQDCSHPHWRAVQGLMRRLQRVPRLDIALVAGSTESYGARRAVFACCNLISQAKGLEQLQLHCSELVSPICLLEYLAPSIPQGLQSVTLTSFPWPKAAPMAAAHLRALISHVPYVRVDMRCCTAQEVEHASGTAAASPDPFSAVGASCHSNVSEHGPTNMSAANLAATPGNDLMPAVDLAQLLTGDQAAHITSLHQAGVMGLGVSPLSSLTGDAVVQVGRVRFEAGRLVGLAVGLPQFSCCGGGTDPADASAMCCDGLNPTGAGAVAEPQLMETVAGLGQWLAVLQLQELELFNLAGADPNLAVLLPHLLHCAMQGGLPRLVLSEPGASVDDWVCTLVAAVQLHGLLLPCVRSLGLYGASLSPGYLSELLAPGVLLPDCQVQVCAPIWCDVEASGASHRGMGFIEAWLDDHLFRVSKDVATLMEAGNRVNGGEATSSDAGFGMGLKAHKPQLPPVQHASVVAQGCGLWLMVGAYGYKAHWADQGCWGSTCDDNPWSVCDPLEQLATRLAPLLSCGVLRTLRLAGHGVGALLDRVSSLEGVEMQDPDGRHHHLLIPRKPSRLDMIMTDVEPQASGVSTQDTYCSPTTAPRNSNTGKGAATYSTPAASRLSSPSLLMDFLQPLKLATTQQYTQGLATMQPLRPMSLHVQSIVFDGRVDWGQLQEALADTDLLSGVAQIIITRTPTSEGSAHRMAAALAGCANRQLQVLLLQRTGPGGARGGHASGSSRRGSMTLQILPLLSHSGLSLNCTSATRYGSPVARTACGRSPHASSCSCHTCSTTGATAPLHSSAPSTPACTATPEFSFVPAEVGAVGPGSRYDLSAPSPSLAAAPAGCISAVQCMLAHHQSGSAVGSAHNWDGSHHGTDCGTPYFHHSASSGIRGEARGSASKRQPAELVAWLRGELAARQCSQDMVALF